MVLLAYGLLRAEHVFRSQKARGQKHLGCRGQKAGLETLAPPSLLSASVLG